MCIPTETKHVALEMSNTIGDVYLVKVAIQSDEQIYAVLWLPP